MIKIAGVLLAYYLEFCYVGNNQSLSEQVAFRNLLLKKSLFNLLVADYTSADYNTNIV